MLRDPFDLWSSSRELERLRREMNRLFDRPGGSMPSAAAGYPAMNVWANDAGLIVTAELPGINPEELDISVRENVLTLTGVRNAPELAGRRCLSPARTRLWEIPARIPTSLPGRCRRC